VEGIGVSFAETEEEFFDRMVDCVSEADDEPVVLLDLLRLHRPMGRSYDLRVCEACSNACSGSDEAKWPCLTTALIAAYLNMAQLEAAK
jgi:hypothetical protein